MPRSAGRIRQFDDAPGRQNEHVNLRRVRTEPARRAIGEATRAMDEELTRYVGHTMPRLRQTPRREGADDWAETDNGHLRPRPTPIHRR